MSEFDQDTNKKIDEAFKSLPSYHGTDYPMFVSGYRAALKDRAAVEADVLCQNNNDALTVQRQAEALKELRRQLDLSYAVLGMCGVPEERARSVPNGIMVLASRYAKEAAFQEEALKEQAKATQRKIADELEKIGQNPSAQMVLSVKI